MSGRASRAASNQGTDGSGVFRADEKLDRLRSIALQLDPRNGDDLMQVLSQRLPDSGITSAIIRGFSFPGLSLFSCLAGWQRTAVFLQTVQDDA